MHNPSKLMSIVECYQAYHAFIMRASEIIDILNAVNHGASKCQMIAANTLPRHDVSLDRRTMESQKTPDSISCMMYMYMM